MSWPSSRPTTSPSTSRRCDGARPTRSSARPGPGTHQSSRSIRATSFRDHTHLRSHLDSTPLLARKHYIESGTLRHFEVRYVPAVGLAEALARSSSADGLVVVALADTPQERA